MDKRIEKYLKLKFRKKGSPAARIIDLVGLRIFVFLAAYFLFFLWLKKLIAPLYLAALSTVAVSMILYKIDQNRFERFRQKHYRLLREEIISERLMLWPPEKKRIFYEELFSGREAKTVKGGFVLDDGSYVRTFYNHPSRNITAQEVLDSFLAMQSHGCKRCVCFSLSDYEPAARAFAHDLHTARIILYDMKKTLLLAGDLSRYISEEEIEQRIIERCSERILSAKQLKKEALAASKFKPYLITAAAFAAAALFTRLPYYLFSMAGVCCCLGVFSMLSGRAGKQE